jgi:aspartate/methionine/tyrosine aminotransferase
VNFFEEMETAIRNHWPKPKMLILNFPSNPTTQCVELEFFEKVVAMAKEYGIFVVHDLAYADIVFDGYKAPSIMQVPGAKDVAVEFFTLSKSYNMPAGGSASWSATRSCATRWRASRATTTTAPSRPSRWRRSPRWKGRRIA